MVAVVRAGLGEAGHVVVGGVRLAGDVGVLSGHGVVGGVVCVVRVRHPAPAPLVVQIHTCLRLGLHLPIRAVNEGSRNYHSARRMREWPYYLLGPSRYWKTLF